MELREYMNLSREERLNEVGTEPDCPLCGKPRVSRSDYIRCNPCGVSWLQEEMHLANYLSSDPRIVRAAHARTANIQKPTADKAEANADDFVLPRL